MIQSAIISILMKYGVLKRDLRRKNRLPIFRYLGDLASYLPGISDLAILF